MGRMGLMGRMGRMGRMGLMGLMGLLGLMACSEDREDGRVTMEVVACVSAFTDEQESAATRTWEVPSSYVTRSWTPPSPYVTYNNINSKFAQQKDLVNRSIGVFFTQDGQSPMKGTFSFRAADSSWRLNMDINNDGSYYLYGYIPEEDVTSADIAPNGTYSNGAVLTLTGLNTVTPSDICVLIGAKEGSSIDNDATGSGESLKRLQAGQFAVNAKATSSEGVTGNYIFLLFDHLYSALRFRFTVHPDYALLRTIKLRKLELTTFADKNGTGVKSKYDATITLKKNSAGKSPIESIVFTPNSASANVLQVPIFDGNVELPVYPALPLEFMGCFVPGDNIYFKLRTTYDVYDNNRTEEHPEGNLIRQGCKAENSFNLKDKFGSHLETTRGHSYSYTITVQPTYLYWLSEPDLDNPTVKITE